MRNIFVNYDTPDPNREAGIDAITNFVIGSGYAAVSSTDDETQYDTDPPPGDARMHFADYNLFYNPDSPNVPDYTIQVEPDDKTPTT